MDKTYNGWANYETWVWNLWLREDEGEIAYWLERAIEINKYHATAALARRDLAIEMENSAIDVKTDLNIPHGPFVDLMAAAIGNIDWNEIADSVMDDAIADSVMDDAIDNAA